MTRKDLILFSIICIWTIVIFVKAIPDLTSGYDINLFFIILLLILVIIKNLTKWGQWLEKDI